MTAQGTEPPQAQRSAVRGTTTAPAETKTTSPEPGRRRLPLRWWIVGWIVLTAGIGLTVLVTLAVTLMRRDMGETANAQITQEIDEFRTLARAGVDPATGEPFVDGQTLLTTFLSMQRPGDGELLLGYVAATGRFYVSQGADTPSGSDYMATTDEALLGEIFAAPTGISNTEAGEVRWGRADIEGPDGRTSLIILVFMAESHREATETAQLMVLVGAGAMLLTGFIAWWVAGRVLTPVTRVRQAAAEISERDLTRRLPVRGTDELADLSATFNAMLARLEQAFSTQQRFVDDAGHELRTPITVIRGHLELMGDDPAERAATVEIVTGELDRMNRIVSDLLTLAKSDQPDYVRLGEPVDIAELTMELDAKLQTLADRRWLVGQVADGPAVIDEQRVSQAVLQLATNATQHTDDGSTITLSSRFFTAEDGAQWVCFVVADHGPGVAPEDRERIFERFSRGTDDVRPTGAGLGLAIVRTIAEGHDGTVHVEQTPGGGATFILAMPTRLGQAAERSGE